MPSLGPSSWTAVDVGDWLGKELELPDSVVAAFRENAISGSDLLTLTDDELTQDLGCKPLQARKIRNALLKMGFAAPQATGNGSSVSNAATTPRAAAPSPTTPTVSPVIDDPGFSQEDLVRYRHLQDAIAGLDALQVPVKVQQAQHYSAKVQQSLARAQQTLQASKQALQEAEEEHKKLVVDDKWYPGKVLGGKGKQEEKKAAAGERLTRATEALRGVEAQVADLRGQLAEAQKQQSAWHAKESELATARRELEVLVDRMFASPAWRAAPRMAAIGDAARVLDGQAAEAARGVATYGRGAQLLDSAVSKLEQAMQALSRTQMFGAMELMTIRRHNFGMDMVEVMAYRRANEACQAAARNATEAGGILGPGLPTIDRDVLDAARRGLFVNMLVGGTLTDVMQMAAVRRSMEAVKRMMAQCRAAASWAHSNLAVYQHKNAELTTQAAGKRRELEAARQAALKAGLTASDGVGPVAALEQLSLI